MPMADFFGVCFGLGFVIGVEKWIGELMFSPWIKGGIVRLRSNIFWKRCKDCLSIVKEVIIIHGFIFIFVFIQSMKSNTK